ncbi:MAG: metallophosphoesterase, partial [Fibrobacteres bacterium]|nr:metallophosphoesterase [Fibrobacterota bacterium]
MHIIIILFFIISFQITAGQIISPCNASPTFVLKGDTLQIQYKRDHTTAIDSIVLSGPFQRYKLSIIDSIVQEIVWDSLTMANYNIKLFSIVPQNTPSDLYDLLIYAGDDSDTSYKTVRVLSTFPRTYSFIHLTDAHISREWGNGYALELQYTSRLVKLINILGVEFVVNTGDLIMEYSNDNGFGRSGSVDIIWSNFFNGAGGYDGFRKMNVPQFLVPGNHDYRSNYTKPVGWNIYCGYRNYSFCYGDSRFLAFDGELGTDYPTKQLEASKEWLKENGSGVFRTLLIHNRTNRNTPFCDSNKINLALMGHTHANAIYSNGKTPTRELVTASAGHFGQVGTANV